MRKVWIAFISTLATGSVCTMLFKKLFNEGFHIIELLEVLLELMSQLEGPVTYVLYW